ncbi:MAG: OmpA family protein [Sutterellaceae bacterium]|nr:OmpA family protein [Burkholderiaceae bacterium]MCX7901584.1 OmpA family protein [Burkholderiaceae bacterium]MDW8429916.1 OmpA family protein [Sutterellaceae bacterium]
MEPPADTARPAVVDRPEARGFWGAAWPLIALAIIVAVLLRACVAIAPPPPTPFDAAAAARAANDSALAALSALPPRPSVEDALRALNLLVVNFAPGSAEVPPDAHAVLTRAAAVIAALPAGTVLELGGHTDDTGTDAANAALSQARAQAVLDFLVAAGVPRDRLVARGYGAARPVANNATEEGRFRNRRIEFARAG